MNLTNPYRAELATIPYLNEAIDWVLARINGVWLVEHDVDGHHTAITVTDITVNGGDVTAADGDGIFGGDVTVQSGGSLESVFGQQLSVSLGYSGGGLNLNSGTRRWTIVADSQASPIHHLKVTDASGAVAGHIVAVKKRGTDYFFVPGSAAIGSGVGVYLGDSGVSNERWSGVYASSVDASTLFKNAGAEIQSGFLTPAQITADQNNYAPTGFGSARILRISTDAARNITGHSSATNGNLFEYWNVGAFNAVLKHQSASSTAGNRFICPGAADYTLTPGQCVSVHYDATAVDWRVKGI